MRNLMVKAVAWKQAHVAREEGQTVVEYALVVGLISIVLIGLLVGFGTNIVNAMQDLVDTAIGS